MPVPRFIPIGLLLLAAVCAACSSPSEPSEPMTFELAPGQSATYGALSVQFVSVSVDSRCPLNALCIQQGDAFFMIETRVRGANATPYELQINDPARRRVVHAGYAIEAGALMPYPFTINPTTPDQYRLTLMIDRE